MSNLRQVTLGIGMALLSALLVFASLSLALMDGSLLPIARLLTPTITPNLLPSLTTQPGQPTSPPTLEQSATPPQASPTPSPTANLSQVCNYPLGWQMVTVQLGDSLESLAQTYNITVAALMQANCLLPGMIVQPGHVIFVPPQQPTRTNTVYVCGKPSGWVTYIVKSGDTLYRLARAFGTTVSQLQQANCMGSSTTLIAGQQLYVPNVPTRTPNISPTSLFTPSPTPTPTPAPGTTEYPTPTMVIITPATPSPTMLPSFTPTPETSPISTPTPVTTASPTSEIPPPQTPTPTLSPSDTPTPSSPTPTETPEALPSTTPTPTDTQSAPPTSVPSPTPSMTSPPI